MLTPDIVYPSKLTILGPYLSVIFPIIGIERPVANIQMLIAWPSKDISQPISFDIEMSETGKAICAPEAIKNIAKFKPTIIQPYLICRLRLSSNSRNLLCDYDYIFRASLIKFIINLSFDLDNSMLSSYPSLLGACLVVLLVTRWVMDTGKAGARKESLNFLEVAKTDLYTVKHLLSKKTVSLATQPPYLPTYEEKL